MNNTVKVDFNVKTGKKVMPLHGFNSGPMTKVFTYDARPWFVKGGFPYVRLHDVEYPYGSGEFVDIPCIFKNFDADVNDPASYNFANTDEYIRQSLNVGSKIIFRLGVSIEHSPHKRYIDPPKDYMKWAQICEHIIRHYNEGWANGYEWNIEYWEIWNEPDLHDDQPHELRTTWGGSLDEFVELYVVAARHLKGCFPHLKIGGCGFAAPYKEFINEFYKKISAITPRVPLDFHSWHYYGATPSAYIPRASQVREMLREHGYGDVETLLDEWNLMYRWGPRENQSPSYPAMKDERGASFYAGTLCVLQEHTDTAVATCFEADVVKEFCGIFDVDQMCIGGLTKESLGNYLATLKPTKGFYAFMRYNTLYRMGNQVQLEGTSDDLFATAASGENGNGLLIANPGDTEQTVQLKLAGVSGTLAVRLTDKTHTDERITEITPSKDSISMTLGLKPHSFVYIGTDLDDPVSSYS